MEDLLNLKPTAHVRFVRTHENAKLPTKGTEDAVGFDLYAAEEVTLLPNRGTLVKTGWNVAFPKGYEGQVRSRSGLALKHGVFVLNSPGTIDPDYRGALGVILFNTTNHAVAIEVGDRVAQLVVAPVAQAAMVEVEAFSDDTARGSDGFGSTGR